MTGRWRRQAFWPGSVALLALLAPAGARAQSVEAYRPVFGRLSLGGDATGTMSPSDTLAYFNYANYDEDPLRSAQVRLMAQWSLSASVSFLGEVRAESGVGVEGAAWYLRWHPWATRQFDIQVGRIPPVIGLFAREPYGRDNPLIDAPLAYQYLMSLRPDALPAAADDLIRMRGRGWEPAFPVGSAAITTGIPIVSAFRWDTGGELHWHAGRTDWAGAVTRGSMAVPAVGRDVNGGVTFSGRFAIDAPGGLTFGVSGARGPWIQSSTLALVPAALHGDNSQTLVGADAQLGWGRWLVRAEEIRSVFTLPLLKAPNPTTHLAAWSGYVEGRYRLLPRWQVAARVEDLNFSTVVGTLNGGLPITWDAPVERVSVDVGYRVERQLEIRVGGQMNWRHGGRILERNYPVVQALFWF